MSNYSNAASATIFFTSGANGCYHTPTHYCVKGIRTLAPSSIGQLLIRDVKTPAVRGNRDAQKPWRHPKFNCAIRVQNVANPRC